MIEMTEGNLETVTYRERSAPPVQVTGWVIGHVNTRDFPTGLDRGPRVRWSDNWAWRTQSGLLVLARESWSLVFHTQPTSCTTTSGTDYGERCTVAEMTRELERMGRQLSQAVSCNYCRPDYPESLRADEIVRFEFVRRTIDRCPEGPPQVARRLARRKMRSGVVTTETTEAGRQLLEQCRTSDPAFAEGLEDAEAEVIA
jgi:hypothetical protein